MNELSPPAKILIIEDNSFVRMQLVKFLQEAGHVLSDVSSAVDYMDVEQGEYDLMILDVRMEPVGGFEFIKHLKGKNIEAPVILVTGDSDPDLLGESSKLGAVAVLIKPVQKERLLKTVSRVLEKSRRAV